MDSPPETIPGLAESRCGTSPPGPPATRASSLSPSATSLDGAADSPSCPLPSITREATVLPTSAVSDQPPKTPSRIVQPDLEGIHRTPVELKSSSIRPTSIKLQSGKLNNHETREIYGSEMHDRMIELELSTFMDVYMPAGKHELPSEADLKIPDMDKTDLLGNREDPVCEQLCKVANAILDACPHGERLTARNTSHPLDRTDRRDYGEKLKVDVCLYPTHEDAIRDYGELAASAKNHRAPTRWAWISLLFEIKTAPSQSPFYFDSIATKADKASTDKASADKASAEKASADKASADKASADKIPSEKSSSNKASPDDAHSDMAPGQNQQGGRKPTGPRLRSDDMSSGTTSDLQAKGDSQSDGTASEAKPAKNDTQPRAKFLRLHQGGRETLGQMTEYVSKLLRRQHRTHCFTVFVYKGQARIIRWDRAGAIVSAPFNFAEVPRTFHQLIWRYACMNQVQRGFDPTVVLATEEEIAAMKDCPAPSDWADRYRNGAVGQRGWPMYKITLRREDLVDEAELQPIAANMEPSQCTSAPVDTTPTFIIGKVYFASDSVVGRGTKCYIAYEVSRNRLVFLKDYWRPTADTLLSEGDVLIKLRTGGVQFVPTPVASGDVYSDVASPPQTSCTQSRLPKDTHTSLDHIPLTHNRLVSKEIGYPLEDHEDGYDLVLALLYALRAHAKAWKEQKTIHRDVSELNVVLWSYIDVMGVKQTIGLLIDWDLSKQAEFLALITRPGRSGTWPFMSARLLRYPKKKHEATDDIESIIHLLQWMCFRFYRHTITGATQLRNRIIAVFEGHDRQAGQKSDLGGDDKYTHIRSGTPAVMLLDQETPLAKLLRDLAVILQQHYLAVEPQWQRPPTTKQATSTRSRKAAPDDVLHFVESLPKQPSILPAVPSVPAELMTYDKVFAAFASAVRDPEAWDAVQKTEDQFACFKASAVVQRSMDRSEYLSSGSKRASEEDLELVDQERAGRVKRTRSGTTGLTSANEDLELPPGAGEVD